MSSQPPSILPFVVMCIGMFIALLDIQIVASSLQDIGGGLSAAQDEISWVQTAYLIAEIIMIPLSGWLTRVFSTRWLFTASAAGFTLASMLCGLAWNIESMIAFRALQGLLGASMIPTVFTSSFHFFPGPKRVYSAAVIGTIASIAPTLGPVIGGWITDTLNWHWLFYVNLMPGHAITLAVPVLVRIDEPDLSLLRGADYLGIALMALGLGTLEYVLEEGTRWNWFDDATIRDCAGVPGIAGCCSSPAADVRQPGRRPARLRQPQLHHRLHAVVHHRYRHLHDHLSDAALPGLRARLQRLADRNGDLLDRRRHADRHPGLHRARPQIRHALADDGGAGLFGAAMWSYSFITHDWGGAELLVPQVLRGFPQVFAVAPSVNLGLGSLPPERLKYASGLFNMMRNLGGAVGIAVAAAILNDQTNSHFVAIASNMTPANGAMTRLLDAQRRATPRARRLADGHAAALKQLWHLAYREAATLAYADAFRAIMAAFIFATLLVPFLRVVATAKAPPTGTH